MSITEIANAPGQLAASLHAGLDLIRDGQEIVFRRYNLQVLPLDGFLFWVLDMAADPITVQGSMHATNEKTQTEDASNSVNSLVFTSKEEIDAINQVSPTQIYMGTFNGVRFAFRDLVNVYKQAGLFHYRCQAVNSYMESQVIDNPATVNLTDVVVSNSLPMWLALNANGAVYPSFAVPPNIKPPYIVAHIDPNQTNSLQVAPFVDTTGSSYHLATDTVRFTTYGLRHAEAVDYLAYLMDASLPDDAPFGVMGMPIIRDEKRTQVDIQVLAERKTITFEVSYYQARMQQIAMQLILSAGITITPLHGA